MANIDRDQIPTGGGGPSRQLRLSVEHQEEDYWCWAACAASVGNYYHGAGAYTQCGIVNACQNKTTCCTNPSDCNQHGDLDKALTAANSYERRVDNSVSFSTLQEQIDIGQPVGIRVEWPLFGGHFLMISGYNTSPNKITIQDPWYGGMTIKYSSYQVDYQGGPYWTHTYYTKRN